MTTTNGTTTNTAARRVSDAELVRQIARKLAIAWAVVHRDTNQLVTTTPGRREAYVMRRATKDPRKHKVVRVDLRVKGLSA